MTTNTPTPDLAALCRDARTAWDALGHVNYSRKPSEQANIKFRRSLYFVKAFVAGDLVTPDGIRSVRPGFGAAPKYFETIIGKRLKVNVEANSPVRLVDLID